MSNRAIICTTDGPDKGCTIWDHDQHVDARHSLEQDPDGWGSEYGDAALDEIERLRAESARRMVWLETEQRAHAQTHAALVDMTERAAHPEVNDNMVERAAGVIWAGTHVARTPETLPSATDLRRGGDWYRRNARAALEAALSTKEEA